MIHDLLNFRSFYSFNCLVIFVMINKYDGFVVSVFYQHR